MSGILPELFGEFEELRDGVPVAHGARSFQRALDYRRGEARARHAVGEIDVQLAAIQVDFLGSDFELEKAFASFIGWQSAQEPHPKFVRFYAATLGEGIASDDVAEFRKGSHNYVRAEAGFAFDAVLDLRGDSGEIAFAGAEGDIATLEESLDILEIERFADAAEDVHFDFVVATNVDAAQQADDDRHNGEKYNAGRERK